VSGAAVRILLLAEHVPPEGRAEITGGVEAREYYVSRHLARHHDVRLLADRTAGSAFDHVSVRTLPRRLLNVLRLTVGGLRAPADVVEGSNVVVMPVAWLVAKLRRRPVVFWYPDVLIGSWRGGRFGRLGAAGEWAERRLLRLPVDRFIAISDTVAGKLADHGVPRERIDVVPCGFEPEAVEQAMAEAKRDPRAPVIVVVGRLVPYKRVDVVVSAVAALADLHPKLRLAVVGQGPEQPALAALAARLGVGDRVDFHGFVPQHEEVLALVARSTALVSASEIEGFGINVLEAMALGVPFVVADTPVFREVTAEGTGGLLFRTGNAQDLADKLARLLDDPARQAACGAAGRARAAAFTWEAVADQTAAVYESVLRARRSHR
jgi:glycosyltransferase involved in cell wall biosynthesis